MMICQRRTLLWRYCAVGSFLVYVLAFSAFLGFLTSPTTFRNNEVTGIDWMLSNSSFSSLLVSKEDILRRHSIKYKPSKPNETHLENLHRNMTLLKANMSGVNVIVQQIQDLANKTKHQSQVGPAEKVPNPHPFEYLINCPKLCSSVPGELFMIAYVHTAPDHYKRRMVIRQTWGDSSNYKVQMRLVFVMGSHSASAINRSNSEIQQSLYFEAEEYADIVQEDFLDSYRNLTYKGIAALKWITNYCSRAKFVVKTDDDIFVNSFGLIARLKRLLKPKEANGVAVVPTGVLMCLVWTGMIVMREGKWKVDVSEWKESTYPTYCSGSAFIMSTDVAISLHAISYHVPFFWVDDFYVTGLLPLKLGNITHTQIASSYVLNGGKLVEKFTGPQWYMYLFSHVHNLNAIQSVWNTLVTFHQGLSAPSIQYALPGQLQKVTHKVDP